MTGQAVPDRYEAYAKQTPDARFTDWLQARSEPAWTEATQHRFIDELAEGALDPSVYRRYLVQDHAFLKTLVALLGHAVAQAPTIEQARPYVVFLDALTNEENDYFQRALEALEVPVSERQDPWLSPVTEEFRSLLTTGAEEGAYAETLAVLLPVEWVYLDWASQHADASPEAWYLSEWIDLHANPEFEAFVSWMRTELDTLGPTLGPARQERVEELFTRVAELEVAFWEQAYES